MLCTVRFSSSYISKKWIPDLLKKKKKVVINSKMHDHVFHTIEFHSVPIFPVLRVIQFFLHDIPIFLTSYIFHLIQYHISFKVIKENINKPLERPFTEELWWQPPSTEFLPVLYSYCHLFFSPSPLCNSQINTFSLCFLTNNSCVVSDWLDLFASPGKFFN